MNETNISTVLVIGAGGQTGQLFLESLLSSRNKYQIEAVVRENQVVKIKKKFKNDVSVSSSLEKSLKRSNDIIILTIPNPISEVLELIVKNVKKTTFIILPQNGVNILPQNLKINNQKFVRLIRASLYTTVSLNKEQKAIYNPRKLRLAISSISNNSLNKNNDHKLIEVDKRSDLQFMMGIQTFFINAGFEVKIFDDYRSMEWTKLIVNSLGSSAVITGLTTRETFRDEKLFEIEIRAIKDRLEIMQAAGIQFAKIPWQNISLLSQLRYVPVSVLKKFRYQIAELISRGRNNQPPAASRKIIEGRPTEISYYLKPFIDLGVLHGLKSYLDETILEIILEHDTKKINLAEMSIEKKIELMLDIYNKYLQKPYIPRNPIITSLVQKITNFFVRQLDINGKQNLSVIRESLDNGKSVIILANHSSHADHPILVRMLNECGYPDLAERIIFIAGMKFKDEIISRYLSDGYARVVVSTPSTKPRTEEENRIAQQVNLKGFLKINKLLNRGNLFVLYAEGTRSRENKLLKAIPSVARYFENPNIKYLLPVGIQGTGDMLPVGKTIPRFAKATVSVGEPLVPSEIQKAVISKMPEEVKNSVLKDKTVRAMINEKTMDYVMKKIAVLLPEKQRGYYSR